MKKFILFVLPVLLFMNCSTSKRFGRFVEKKYHVIDTQLIASNNSLITFHTDKLPLRDTLVKIEKIKHQLIPALIYWEWEKSFMCELSAQHQAKRVESYLLQYADSFRLDKKLQGAQLDISFEEIPNDIIYSHKGNFVFVGYAIGYTNQEIILSKPKTLKMTYRISKNNVDIKKDSIEIKNYLPYLNNNGKFLKRLTWCYIDMYEKYLQQASRESINRILQ